MEGVKVFVGGIIPTQDIAELRRMGVAEVFLPGASTEDVAARDPLERRLELTGAAGPDTTKTKGRSPAPGASYALPCCPSGARCPSRAGAV